MKAILAALAASLIATQAMAATPTCGPRDKFESVLYGQLGSHPILALRLGSSITEVWVNPKTGGWLMISSGGRVAPGMVCLGIVGSGFKDLRPPISDELPGDPA